MRKQLMLACILAVSAAAAEMPASLAQDEPHIDTVTVNASPLEGVWKIAWPLWGNITFGGTHWGPMMDTFCRIEQNRGDLTIHCFRGGGNAGSIEAGTVSLDGAKVHLAWGNMMLRLVFDGALLSPTQIAGKMGVKFSGIEHENPDPSNAEKFSLSEAVSDKAGKAALLHTAIEQFAKGPLTLPHDEIAMGKARGALPSDIAALGTLQTVVYLGSSSRQLPPFTNGVLNLDLDYFSVYAAEFAVGERICGLHQRADGVLDAFLCV